MDRKLSGGERSQLSVSGMERMGWRRVVSGRWRRELRGVSLWGDGMDRKRSRGGCE